MTTQLDQEVAFTQGWWHGLVRDEARLVQWLRKLHGTEIGGYYDYQNFLARFTPDERTTKIFTNIALDEQKHAGLIVNALLERGFVLGTAAEPSTYWSEMNGNITDLKTAAGVNYFGEALAAFRFEVILEHKDTPADIKEMLGIILPDEQFHRETLKRIAGDDILGALKEKHDMAVANLKKR